MKHQTKRCVPRLLLSGLLASLLMVGCGGGGSGGSGGGGSTTSSGSSSTGSPQAAPSFNGFPSDLAGKTLDLDGSSQSGKSATASVSYDKDGNLNKVSITPEGNSPVTWDAKNDTFEAKSGGKEEADARLGGKNSVTATKLISNDESLVGYLVRDPKWQYQTYAVWIKDLGKSGVTPTLGAVSLGTETLGTAIPQTGEVQYRGDSMGRWIDKDGNVYTTTSSTLNPITVVFTPAHNQGHVNYTMRNTQAIAVSAGAKSKAYSYLNITGTLTYDINTNSISGIVSTDETQVDLTEDDSASRKFTGTARARFYGPNAEELGGTITLTSTNGDKYVAGFGARQGKLLSN